MNRQRLALFILVIVFGIAALWSYSAMPRFKTVSTIAAKPDTAVKQAATAAVPVTNKDDGSVLHLSLLDNEPERFTGYRRNIFKSLYADESKILKQKPVVITAPAKAPVAAPLPPAVALPEAAPLARFTFLGYLKKGAVRTIFLARDKDIILVKKGDVIAGRYEATDISDQALSLRVFDSGDEITIPLIENQPLAQTRQPPSGGFDEKMQ